MRLPSPVGNERLTSSTGLVLAVLLVVETLTTLALRTYLNVHLFLGMLLLPPVALKLASTGWRFARYYTRNEPYVRAGPPRLLMRVLAPLLVASTLALFGTGVAMIVVGHRGGQLRTLHTFSFVAWGVLIGVHVLFYLTRVLRDGPWTGGATLWMSSPASEAGAPSSWVRCSPGSSWRRRRFPPSGPSCTTAVTATTTSAAADSASSARRPAAVAVSVARSRPHERDLRPTASAGPL